MYGVRVQQRWPFDVDVWSCVVARIGGVNFPNSCSLYVIRDLLRVLINVIELEARYVRCRRVRSLRRVVFDPERHRRVNGPYRPTSAMSRGKRFTIRCPGEYRLCFISFKVTSGGEEVKGGFLWYGAKGSQVGVFNGAVEGALTWALYHVLFNVGQRVTGAAREARVVRTSCVIVIFVDGRGAIRQLRVIRPCRLFARVKATVCRGPRPFHFCRSQAARAIIPKVTTNTCQAFTPCFKCSHEHSTT